MMTERVPDVAGEIIGWRAWKLQGQRELPVLASATRAFVWPAGKWAMADCEICAGNPLNWPVYQHIDPQHIPHEGHRCGIYAARDRDQLAGLGYAANLDRVVGRVALAGKVIPGDQGWRAQKARVLDITIGPDQEWAWAGLEKRYHCRVQVGNPWAGVKRFGVAVIQQPTVVKYRKGHSHLEPPEIEWASETRYAVIDILKRKSINAPAYITRIAAQHVADKLNKQEAQRSGDW